VRDVSGYERFGNVVQSGERNVLRAIAKRANSALDGRVTQESV
jgi:hypothetical protein